MNGDVVLGDEDALDPENSASVMSSNSGTAVHPVSGAAAAVLTAMQYHPALPETYPTHVPLMGTCFVSCT
jgi:hypothetical protein